MPKSNSIFFKPIVILTIFSFILAPVLPVLAEETAIVSDSPSVPVQESAPVEISPSIENPVADAVPDLSSDLSSVAPTGAEEETSAEEDPTLTPNTNAPDDLDANAVSKDKKSAEEPQMESMTMGEGGEGGNSGQNPAVKEQLVKSDTFSGALTYNYPIATPPGRNGMQPSLALQYNSQSASNNEAFGAGWSVNIPYIERINRKGSDKLYTENYFYSSLSGELVFVSGSEYRAKVDNGDFLKYEFSNNAWLVKDKKGTTYKFGYQAATRQDDPNDSSKAYKWMLEEVRDLNDNWVKYEYYKDAGQIYPYLIKYTGYNTTDGIFEVEFSRESRSDALKSNKTGFTVTTNYRISEIKAKVSGTWTRKYALAYTTTDNASESILDTITEYGQNEDGTGAISLPAVNFDYQAHGEDMTQTISYVMPDAVANGDNIIDINGDGLMDIIQADNGGKNVYINDGQTGLYLDTSWVIPSDFYFRGSQDLGGRIADINGDGLPDLIIKSSYQPSGKIWLNTGSGWQVNTSWTIPSSLPGFDNGNNGGAMVADANGDGLPDILRVRQLFIDHPELNIKEVYLNNGINGWNLDSNWQFAEGFYLISDYIASRLADVNGDGLIDIVRDMPSNYAQIAINNGRGWEIDTNWTLPNETLWFFENFSHVADFNGDGLPDILVMWKWAGNEVKKMFINNGKTGWNYDSNWNFPECFYLRDLMDGYNGRVIDFSGDNLPDLVRINTPLPNAAFLNSGPRANLLKKITYPESGYTDIAYKSSSKIFSQRLIAQTDYNAWETVMSKDIDSSRMQTFTTSGDIDKIDKIKIYGYRSYYADTQTLTVEIVSSSNWSSPVLDSNLTVLSSKTFSLNNISEKAGWLDIDFENDVSVSPNTKYGIRVYTNNSSGPSYRWQYQSTDVYPAGEKYRQTTVSGNKQYIAETGDFSFIVYQLKSGETTTYQLNPSLPYVIDTVCQLAHSDNFGGSYGYAYEYEGGKYYYNNAFDRQFAGFHKATQTDGSGNKTITYFHQGDSTDASSGEYDDHASKIGKVYRTETRDSSDNLYQANVNKWERHNLLKNDSFENWSSGETGHLPDNWTATASTTWSKNASQKKYGSASCESLGNSGGWQDLNQAIDWKDEYRGKTFTLGVWLKGASNHSAYLYTWDGVSSSQPAVNVTTDWQFFTYTFTLSSNATMLGVQVYRTYQNSVHAYIDGAVLVEESSANPDRNFVKLTRATELDYDGNSGHKDKATEYSYDDSTGNLTAEARWGEVNASPDGSFADTGTDKLTTDISYASNATYNIYGLPSQETVTNQSAAKVRESKYYYDNLSLGSVNVGNLTKLEQWKSGADYIDTEKSYDSYGLATQAKDPNDNATSYSYDSYNLYPVTNTNAQNQTTTYAYDYSSGQVKLTTDPNGGEIQNVYDGFDRVKEEWQSNPTTPSTLEKTKAYTYEFVDGKKRTVADEYISDSSYAHNYSYYDGLNRLIQNRKQTEGDSGDPYSTTDTIYDSSGRLWKQSLPYVSQGGSRTSPTTTSNLYSVYSYDSLNRIASTQTAVGTVANAYDDWKTAVTDARGKVKNYYHDAYGRLVKVEEINSGNTYTTNYEYDGNDNLTKITDALSNVRNFTYDGLNRRLTAQDLHATADQVFGTWNYSYDAAGNQISTTDPKGQIVDYSYDALNRVKTETNSYAPDNGLVGYWDLDEGSGTTAHDKSGNDYTATGTGMEGDEWTSAISGKGLQLDGNVEYLTASPSFPTGSFTASIWVDNDGGFANREAMSMQGYTGGWWGMFLLGREANYGKWYFEVTNSSNEPFTAISDVADAGEWTHIVGVYNDSDRTVKIYVNGVLKATQALTGTRAAAYGNLYLGAGFVNGGPISYWNGKIDEPRLYDRALTASEISALYSSPGGREAMGYWDFDEGSGTTAHDRTANANHAALSNVSWVSGISGQAGSFNGSTSYGQIADSSAIQDIWDGGGTVSAVIKPAGAGENDWGTVLDKTDVSYVGGWSINLNSNYQGSCYLYFTKRFSATPGQWRTADRAIAVGANNDIKITYNDDSTGNDPIIYLNGTAVAVTETIAPAGTRSSDVGMAMYVGNRADNGATFDGWIDEPKIYNKSLSASEIYQLYQSAKEGDVAYAYDFCANGIGRLCSVSKSGYAETSEYDALGRAKSQSKVIYNSQNLLKNPNFEQWSAGANNPPDSWQNWSMSSMAQETAIRKSGAYSIKVTAAGDGTGYQDADWNNYYQGKTLTFGAWVYAAEANKVRISLFDGISSSPSDYHPGDSAWHFLTVTKNFHTDANIMEPRLKAEATTAYFDSAILVEGSSIPNYLTTYAYDRLNNPASIANPDGSEVAYEYNNKNLLEKVKYKPNGGSFGDIVSDFDYAPTGQASYVAYANGAATTNTYDADHLYRLSSKVTAKDGNDFQNLTYSYDANNNITQIVDTSDTNTSGTYAYAYDDLNRLLTATGGNTPGGSYNFSHSYAYDAIGNITNKSDVGNYSYAGTGYANPHAVTTAGSTGYSYDRNGNALSAGSWNYGWDFDNRLASATNGTTTETYIYDASGQRIGQTSGATTTHYPTKNYSTDGTNPIRHVFAGDILVATVDGAGTHYVHTDHLTGTGAVSNSSANLEQALSYYPFGQARIDQKTGNFDERRKFSGNERDSATGLDYLNARYYNPAYGKFLSQDPVFTQLSRLDIQLKDPQSWNSYAYARNNPLILTDPNGDFWHIAAGAAIGAVFSGGMTYLQTGDWHQAATAAAGGAVTGATFAAIGPASLLGSAATGALSVATGNSLTRALNGQEITSGTVATDAAFGALGGAISYGVTKAVLGSTAQSTIQANKAAGDAWERAYGESIQNTQEGVVSQLTVKTENGVKVRLDFAGRTENGIVLTECKSSATAPLTRNQTIAFPEIAKTGATVVGQGKPGFPGGTIIAPTSVNIVRP